MHGMEKTLAELHGMLKNAEQSIKKTSPVLVVQKAKGAKGKSKPKSKNKVGHYTKGKVVAFLWHLSSMNRSGNKTKSCKPAIRNKHKITYTMYS